MPRQERKEGGQKGRRERGRHTTRILSAGSPLFFLVLFFFRWLVSGAFSLNFILAALGAPEPGLGSRPQPPALLGSYTRRGPQLLARPSPSSTKEAKRVRPARPKGSSGNGKPPGLGEADLCRFRGLGELGLPARSLPWETQSKASWGCPLRGPGRRWGRWEEIELAGPLHREEPALASGRGVEESGHAAWREEATEVGNA